MVLSGDTAKFPQTTANIEVSGVFPYCKLKLSPAAGLAGLGTTTMTLKLDDQVNPPVLSTFSVNVIEKEPQWSTPATPLTFSVNKNSGSHTLQLNAATDPDASLFATPQTLNYVIVSAPAIGTVSSASAVPATGNGTITYTTPMGQPNTQPDQTTGFTYKVCDNASPQNCSPNKTITVNIVNNAPVISDIGNQIISEDGNSSSITINISDVDDTRTCAELNTSKGSSNTTLIPLTGISVTGVTPPCTLVITPAANGNGGPVNISFGLAHTVTATKSFSVSVIAANDVPSLVSTGAVPGASGSPPSGYSYAHQTLTVTEILPAIDNITFFSGQDPDADGNLSLNGYPQNLHYWLVTPPSKGNLSTGNSTGYIPVSLPLDPLVGASIKYVPQPDQSGSDSFVYKICDSSIPSSCTANVYVDVSININRAPTNITLTSSTVSENSATQVVGTLDTSDPDSGTHTYSIDNSFGDHASFSVSGTTLSIAATNFETKQLYAVRITSTDSGTPSLTFSKDFLISVSNVNEPPTAISLSSNSINENNAPNAIIGTLSATDPDAGSTFTYSITSGTGFSITGNELRATGSFNYESMPTHSVTITATDAGTLNTSHSFTITINNVNDAPTDITLTSSTVSENSATQVVGTLGTSDPDSGTHTYSIDNSFGDHASFSVSGTTLSIAATNFETKQLYAVRITSTDSGTPSLTFSKDFLISVSNVNEPPTAISLSSNSINENNASNAVIGILTTTDPDFSNTFTYAITAGAAHFNINNNELRATNSFNYETASSYSVTVQATDSGGATLSQNFTITINNINEAPTLNTTSAGGTFNEDSSYTITLGQGDDVDTGNTLNYQFVTLPQHGAFGALPAGVTVPASLNGNITYTPQANYVGSDSFSYRVCDNLGLCSVTINSVTLNVQSVNDAPLITADAATSTLIRVSESGPAATITLAAGTDPDGGTLSRKLVTGPTQGTLSGSPTAGSVLATPLSYTPAAGHTGIFQFVYEICDSAAACVTNPTVFIGKRNVDGTFRLILS
jgi:hypothetical protein